MDGLVSGLRGVTLGKEGDEEPRGVQSRSTWAQVVSGEREEEFEGSNKGNTQRYDNAQYSTNDERQRDTGRNGRKHQKQQQEVALLILVSGSVLYHQENEEVITFYQSGSIIKKYNTEETTKNDEWQTVDSHRGRKSQKQPHKEVALEHWGGYKKPPNEQEYAVDISHRFNVEPSEEELYDLSHACDRLWHLDSNRLLPGQDYEIDCGEGKRVYEKEDMARCSLFSSLSNDVFKKPTYSRFCALLDNYNPIQGSKEVVTSEERQEETAFIEEISRTAPIKCLYNYIVAKGIVPAGYDNFKKRLRNLWFDLYSRAGGFNSSSAFEHVFVGEIKGRSREQEVSGFHNWIQFYLQEAKGRVDYHGYILPRRRGQFPDSETQVLTVQFEWNGILKSVSSTLVGVSPEFEIALYTLCFFVGGEDNYVQLGPYSVNIKCHRLGRDKIGSIFPLAQN